ncbi:MAG: hypothetical protein AB1650_06615 [Candidatus Omnitrophota bacterium]
MTTTRTHYNLSLLLILAFIFSLFLPLIDLGFTSDDYGLLCGIKENPFSLNFLFIPVNEHLVPFFRLVLSLEFSMFHYDAMFYYLVNIFLHLLNVLLTVFLIGSLTSNRIIGLVAGLIFGASAAHWRVPMWITTQGQELATFWMLVSSLLFLAFLKTKKASCYFGSIISHLMMLFSFTDGFVYPLFVFLIYLLNATDTPDNKKLKWASIVTIPYLVNIMIILVLRGIFASSHGLLNSIGGIEGIFINLPSAVIFWLGGIFFLFIFPNTGGSALIESLTFKGAIIYAALSFLALIALQDRVNWKKIVKIITPLAFTAFLMIAIPIFPRLQWGFYWFVSRSRYAYSSGPLIAGCFAILISNIKLLKLDGKLFLKSILVTFLSLTLLLNIMFIVKKLDHIYKDWITFNAAASNYLKHIRHLNLDEGARTYIVKRSLLNNYVDWNVDTELIVRTFIETPRRKSLSFINFEEIKFLDQNKDRVFWVDETGNLFKINSFKGPK